MQRKKSRGKKPRKRPEKSALKPKPIKRAKPRARPAKKPPAKRLKKKAGPLPSKKPPRKSAPIPSVKKAGSRTSSTHRKIVRAAPVKGKAKSAPRKTVAQKRASTAAKKGWETRRRKALQAEQEKKLRDKYRKPGKKTPGPKEPKTPDKKRSQMASVRRLGGRFLGTNYYEHSGFIHRIYEKGDYDPESFRVDPALIEAMIEREISEGSPGIFFATVRGVNRDGVSIERNTKPLPTQIGMGELESDRIAEIIEEYELVGINQITNNFLPERQWYDNTTKGERKNIRRIRRRGH